MTKCYFVCLLSILLVCCSNSFAKGAFALTCDSSFCTQDSSKIGFKHFIVPTLLIGYGVVGLNNDKILFLNQDIRIEINEHVGERQTIDNYTQYMPAAFIYGFHLAGWKGVHSTSEVLAINALSYGIMGMIVNPLKYFVDVERPDHTSNNSFPSGHTAMAFCSAEMLWREYSSKSKVIGYAGYGLAAFTGFYRIRNNRHWLSDVATGAGIGILSTKLAYCLYPNVKRLFTKKSNIVFLPYVTKNNNGLMFSMTF